MQASYFIFTEIPGFFIKMLVSENIFYLHLVVNNDLK